MATKYPNLVAHLRSWGIEVIEQDNWQDNGRPWSGNYFFPKAVICHHTASNSDGGNFPSKNTVLYGRGERLPGPLCQFLLGRNGQVIIITGEGSNHAGPGGPIGVIRRDMGNYDAWGIEAENNGIGEPWPTVQLQAYYRLCAALLELMNTDDVSRVIGHKEYTSRKIDPNGINMNEFRGKVADTLRAGRPHKYRPPVKLSSFKIGNRNADIIQVKRRLINRKMARFDMTGPYANHWGSACIDAFARWQRHLGVSNANGKPDKFSLNKMGLNVVPESVRPRGDIRLYLCGPSQDSDENRRLKAVLREHGYGLTTSNSGGFGASAQWALKKWQRDIGSYDTGLPDKSSLQALGFNVILD